MMIYVVCSQFEIVPDDDIKNYVVCSQFEIVPDDGICCVIPV